MYFILKLVFLFNLNFGNCQAQPSGIADRIIDFALKNLKKKVDRGKCWDLANAALNKANADWSTPFNFGTPVKISDIQKADIIQFTKVKFVFNNGSMSFPQHTAVVYRVNKKEVTVFHQNFNNKKYVDTLTFGLDDIKSGKLDIYRPKEK